jgi:pimeloyl-ACP methyl ester carboxylesterase
MAKLNINGATLEVAQQGDGDTVLFVHGSNSDYRTWEAQMAEFSQHYRAVAFSRRFHWPNEKITEGADYSMLEHLDDLKALIQSLGETPVHLVGHSYGAFLCLLLAMREPQLIRSLVLGEAPVVTLFITMPPKPQQILKLLVTRPRTAVALIKFAATGLVPATKAMEQDDPEKSLRIFGPTVLGREAFNAMSPPRLAQARANNFKAEFVGSGFLPVESAAVRRVQIPALLVTSQQSQPLFHRLTDRLEALLPHTERASIPSASHIAHENNPAAYNAAVLDFLQRH